MDLPTGRRILPDFLAFHANQDVTLIEVKPSYVLHKLPPKHKARVRLLVAEEYALAQGWKFAIWTEKDLR